MNFFSDENRSETPSTPSFFQQKHKVESVEQAQRTAKQIKNSEKTLTQPELFPDEEELSDVQTVAKDMQVEEFPEGPYGASVYLDQKIGKSSPWKVDQHVVSRFQDENPVS